VILLLSPSISAVPEMPENPEQKIIIIKKKKKRRKTRQGPCERVVLRWTAGRQIHTRGENSFLSAEFRGGLLLLLFL
jgi:hypothetical protein